MDYPKKPDRILLNKNQPQKFIRLLWRCASGQNSRKKLGIKP
jgi:hypothetical protein